MIISCFLLNCFLDGTYNFIVLQFNNGEDNMFGIPPARTISKSTNKTLSLENLEAREVPAASDLLPTIAELRTTAYQSFDSVLVFNNRQEATKVDTNAGSEVYLYTFTPKWDQPYNLTVNTTSKSNMDSVIALYDPSGARIGFNDDVSKTNPDSQIVSNLTGGLKYTLAVTSFDESVTGAYTVAVKGLLRDDTFEPSNNLKQAKAIPASGATVTAVMADSADFYSFTLAGTAKEGSKVSMNFSNRLGDLDLYLLDSKGNQLLSSEGSTDQESISTSGLSAGKYYVKVAGYGNAYNPTYTLTTSGTVLTPRAAATIQPDRFEVGAGNNTLGTATNLGSIQGTSNVSNVNLTAKDADFYKFTLGRAGTAGEEILVKFQTSLGDIDCDLYNSKGSRIKLSWGVGDQERFDLNGLAADTYTLKVFGYGGVANPDYNIRFNYGITAATPVELPFSGTITPLTPPTPNQNQQPPTGDWTVLVYMTSTDLAYFGNMDVNEMEEGLTRFGAGAKIALFWDQWNQPTNDNGKGFATGNGTQPAWTTAGRAVLSPDSNLSQVKTSFEILPEQNTGDPAVLRDFLLWGAANAPAKNYALVMWDHGGALNGMNYDDESNDRITITELRSAVLDAGRINPSITTNLQLIQHDECLLGTAEQYYMEKTLAPIVIASSEVVGGDGNDYRTCFKALEGNTALVTPRQLAQSMVNSYSTQYATDRIATFSAIDSSKMDAFAARMKEFVTIAVAMPDASYAALRTALANATAFEAPEMKDLRQFMTAISTNSSIQLSLRTAATNVNSALDQAVFAKFNDNRQTGGMSAYLPSTTSQESRDYAMFSDYENATNWSQFVNRMLGKPARARAGAGGLEGHLYERGRANGK